jgi:hypothetical protein
LKLALLAIDRELASLEEPDRDSAVARRLSSTTSAPSLLFCRGLRFAERGEALRVLSTRLGDEPGSFCLVSAANLAVWLFTSVLTRRCGFSDLGEGTGELSKSVDEGGRAMCLGTSFRTEEDDMDGFCADSGAGEVVSTDGAAGFGADSTDFVGCI